MKYFKESCWYCSDQHLLFKFLFFLNCQVFLCDATINGLIVFTVLSWGGGGGEGERGRGVDYADWASHYYIPGLLGTTGLKQLQHLF